MPRALFIVAALASLLSAVAAAPAQEADVDIALDQFGVGGAWRPGDFVGVRLTVTARPESNLDQATAAWIQWDVPNADGDIAGYGRPITLTKGQPRSTWLYAPLPPDTHPASVWPVIVYEYADGRRGRELGGTRISPPASGRVDVMASMIGVVGRQQMGLNQLKMSPTGTIGMVYTAHEDTRGVYGIKPQDLCDRWEGLKPLEAIAWSEELPQDLGATQSEALREWIRRGGHLIVSLPEDSNPWGLGESGKTDLEDLLPTLAPRKDEDVPLEKIRPVLSKQGSLDPSADLPLGLRVFQDLRGTFNAIDNGYTPLIALPDGRVVAIQRIFGHGRITLVGIDLAGLPKQIPLPNGLLGGLPQCDVFWNRVLGRRADSPSVGELAAAETDDRLNRGTPTEIPVGTEDAFRAVINMSGKAITGLFTAMVLFFAYWVVAGPGGFAVLRHYKYVRHAWVAFAASAGVFTALAWGGVNILRQNNVDVRHVTFLDHIARPAEAELIENESDPQLQRAVSWLTVYLPGYGDTSIGIESLSATAGVPAQRDMLASWTPPRNRDQAFTNTARYTVDVGRDPDDYDLPARSTATQLYANWMGGVGAWGGLLRSDPDDPIRVEQDASGNPVLRGSIRNELPGDLSDVRMIWIWNKRVPPRAYARGEGGELPWTVRSGAMLNVGRMYGQAVIGAGASVPIPAPSASPIGGAAISGLADNITKTYVEPYEGSSWMPTGGLTDDKRRQFIEMLSIYRQLDPPKYLKGKGGNIPNPETMMARRLLGRELDLSPWFVRPCLIVIGYLENSECPIPLRVDGKPVPSDGLTVVRWIYPLPVDPEIAFPPSPPGARDQTP